MSGKRIGRALASAGALALFAAAPAAARTRDVWVAAVPISWNSVPNGRDAIMDTPIDRADTIFPTVVYRRFSPGWEAPFAQSARAGAERQPISRPLIPPPAAGNLRTPF